MPLTIEVGHIALLLSAVSVLYTVLGRKDRGDEQRLKEIQVYYGEQIRLLERRLTVAEDQHDLDIAQIEALRVQHGECHKQIGVLSAQLARMQETTGPPPRPRPRT